MWKTPVRKERLPETVLLCAKKLTAFHSPTTKLSLDTFGLKCSLWAVLWQLYCKDWNNEKSSFHHNFNCKYPIWNSRNCNHFVKLLITFNYNRLHHWRFGPEYILIRAMKPEVLLRLQNQRKIWKHCKYLKTKESTLCMLLQRVQLQ